MASRGNKVEQSVNTVVPETRVSLDPAFLRQDIIILTFEVSNNLSESLKRHRYMEEEEDQYPM